MPICRRNCAPRRELFTEVSRAVEALKQFGVEMQSLTTNARKAELDVILFDRGTRNVRLTEAGRRSSLM